MQYRSRADIAAAILKITKNGAIKTHIMYRAFLSYPQLREYLNLLVRIGSLDYDKVEKTYHTTPKGRQFLEMYNAMDKMVPRTNMFTKILD